MGEQSITYFGQTSVVPSNLHHLCPVDIANKYKLRFELSLSEATSGRTGLLLVGTSSCLGLSQICTNIFKLLASLYLCVNIRAGVDLMERSLSLVTRIFGCPWGVLSRQDG